MRTDVARDRGIVGIIRKDRDDGGDAAAAEEILTAEKAAAAVFAIAEPRGYYHVQVDAFVGQVEQSLRHWEGQVFEREERLHELSEENDRLQYDNQSLKAQIEIFRVNGSPMVDGEGNYLTESQMPGAATPDVGGREAAAAQEEIAYLSSEVDRLTAEAQSMYEQNMAVYEQNTALHAQVETLTAQMAQMSEVYASMEARLAVATPPAAAAVDTGDGSPFGATEDEPEPEMPVAASPAGAVEPMPTAAPVEDRSFAFPPGPLQAPPVAGAPGPLSTSRGMGLPPAPPPASRGRKPQVSYPPAAPTVLDDAMAPAPLAAADVTWDETGSDEAVGSPENWLHVERTHSR